MNENAALMGAAHRRMMGWDDAGDGGGLGHYVGGGTEGGSPDPQNGNSKEGAQTWYYMYRVTGGGAHAMAYDPKNKVVYDINSWRDENDEEIPVHKRAAEHPLEPLSVAYQYRVKNATEWTRLSTREAGNKWALCPINVPDPAAATAWFQSHTGKGWKYSAGFNNCSIYAMDGLAAGGAKIYHVGLSPAPSSVNSKPTIYWQFPKIP